MTRINAGITPVDLSHKHLLAEHREIIRVPNLARAWWIRNCMEETVPCKCQLPQEFTLGEGHVKFFYNKQLYLMIRYLQLYAECRKRGYNVSLWIKAWTDNEMPEELMNDWRPTKRARELVQARIKERTAASGGTYKADLGFTSVEFPSIFFEVK